MATPHIAASPGDFAELVLLPGDPLRARHIAAKHLVDARQVTGVRNMLGFTGIYDGQPVSVMGTGMGIPSLSIYATELVQEFGCKRLIRVGSCGAVHPDVRVRDIIAASGASTDSAVNRQRLRGHDLAAVADFDLLRAVVEQAERSDIPLRVGQLFSSDLFYRPDDELYAVLAAHGILAVEMEAAGLYGLAAATNAQSLTVCTVSDHIIRNERLSTEERETGFDQMIGLVLDALI